MPDSECPDSPNGKHDYTDQRIDDDLPLGGTMTQICEHCGDVIVKG